MTTIIAVVGAYAQAPAVVQVPFVSNIAGLAPGSGATQCATDIPTPSIGVGPFNYGDGCPANQATFSTILYSASIDSFGNFYLSDYNHFELRVLYEGGAALAAAIVAANPQVSNLVPQAGYVYDLAGGSRQASITKTGSPSAYYCNSSGSGPIGINSYGNGCPGTDAYVKPRGASIDANGNVFFPNIAGGTEIKVFCVNCSAGTAAYNLITLENPGVTPQTGYVYAVAGNGTSGGYSGDGGLAIDGEFNQLRSVAVDANENLYITDGNSVGSASNNNVRKVTASTGIITTLAGYCNNAEPTTSGCATGSAASGILATSATFNSPYAVFVDANDNVYVADAYNEVLRVIYQGTGSVVNVTNPQAGYIYTVAGGGATSAASMAALGTLATQLAFGTIEAASMDSDGNIYLFDTGSKYLWRIDGKTGIAVIVGGQNSGPGTGNYCSGSSGPKSVDTNGDGCPSTQALIYVADKIAFDGQGNWYEAESSNGVLRELSFNTEFPATAVGSSSTQPVAVTTVSAANFTAENFTLQGGATSDFSDAGSDTCSLNTGIAQGKTCVFNIDFAPKQAGMREGSVSFSGSVLSSYLSGVGEAANASIDPGTQTTIGTGLSPSGVTTDLAGNLYIADTVSNSVLKVAASGGTPAALISGLNHPAQIAVDGKGNIYVADTGNNRIAMTGPAGGAITALGSGLSAPSGVAVDRVGNVYVADTGNNRVVKIFAIGGQQTLPLTGLSSPAGLALDSAGDLFVADTGNSRVVELGLATSQATVNLGTSTFTPIGVAVDAAGDLFIADATNKQVVIYSAGSTNGNPILTGLVNPEGVALDANDSVYVADAGAPGAIALNRSLSEITFPVTNLNTTSPEPITISDSGNQSLYFNGTQFATATGNTSEFSLVSASVNGCSLGVANEISPGGSCLLTANFSPTVTGNYTETISPQINAANSAQVSAVLSGQAVLLIAASTSIGITSPTSSTIYYGQTVTISATTTFASNGGTPVGYFYFTVDGRQQAGIPFGTGTATLSLTNLAVGAHAVSVSVQLSGYIYASSGNSLSFNVSRAATVTALSITPTTNGAAVGTTFTATVSSPYATGETGTVNFYSGTALLNSVPIAISGGVASYPTTQVTFPSNSFTAVYSGDPNFSGSTSTVMQPAGDFDLTVSSTLVAAVQGSNATNNVVLTPYFGYSGTVTATCSGLPQYAVCGFQPVSTQVSGTAQVSFTVFIYTDTSVSAQNREKDAGSRLAFALLSPFGLIVLLFGRKRLGGSQGWLVLVLVLAVSLASLAGLTGCTNPVQRPSMVTTPASAQTVTVTLTDSNSPQVSHSVGFTLDVCNSSVSNTCQTY